MKTTFKFLPLIGLLLALTGCAAHKAAVKSDTTIAPASAAESEVSYKQALAAIEARRFIIKADGEFKFPDGTTRHSFGNYISMSGSRAVICFSPDLMPGSLKEHEYVDDPAATMTKIDRKKNGDMQFCMKINGLIAYFKNEVLVTLYKNSDQCYVQLYYGLYDTDPIRFKGTVCPAEE